MAPIIKNISLSRFLVGGAAIFIAQFKNHHIVIVGKIVIIPFVIKILRVWVDSYNIFDSANSLDEHRPCASIIVSAAFHPQDDIDIIPLIRSLIWPTDE